MIPLGMPTYVLPRAPRVPADTLPPDVLAGLNPGVRRTVLALRAAGFATCDSGDGTTHAHPCDRDYPYVSIRVFALELPVEAARLLGVLRAWGLAPVTVTAALDGATGCHGVAVQASYDPVDGVALLDVLGLCDAALPPELPA